MCATNPPETSAASGCKSRKARTCHSPHPEANFWRRDSVVNLWWMASGCRLRRSASLPQLHPEAAKRSNIQQRGRKESGLPASAAGVATAGRSGVTAGCCGSAATALIGWGRGLIRCFHGDRRLRLRAPLAPLPLRPVNIGCGASDFDLYVWGREVGLLIARCRGCLARAGFDCCRLGANSGHILTDSRADEEVAGCGQGCRYDQPL
jgi:hypothetical protein